MNERVPEDWNILTIRENLSEVIDNRGRTPPLSDKGCELVEVNSIKEDRQTIDYSVVNKYVSKTIYETWFRSGHPKIGDTLVCTVGSIGNFSYVSENRGCIAQNLVALRPSDDTNPLFLYYLCCSDAVQKGISRILMGAVQPSLRIPHFLDISALFPPLPEQKKIASILTSVDEVIEKIQSQIDKLQDLKKGTMNELLTKGIGHTEFKDSELGKIPKSWKVLRFGVATTSIKSGLSRRLSSQDIGIPVINSGNISSRGLNIDELKYWYFDDPQEAKTENYFLHDGDILLNFINSMSQIGKSCVFESIGRDCIYTTNLFRIQVGNSIAASFLHYLMIHERFQNEISLITKPAVNQASFTKEELSNIAIPVPPLFEQDLILKTLDAIEKNITRIYQKLSQTQSLKKSLMQDLLTGKVRVTVN